MKRLTRKLVCYVRGHKVEQHVLYLRDEVLSAERCARCNLVLAHDERQVGQYPKPATVHQVRSL